MKNEKNWGERRFYGTSMVGERGQVVIPQEARDTMHIKKGDKLLVFGLGQGMVTFTKVESFERFEAHLSKRLEVVRKLIKKTKT